MGQYYTPILGDARGTEPFAEHITGWAYSHDFNNGLKLMEHSYLGNEFVGAITNALIKKSQRVVWAGDYADLEPDGMNLYDHADLVHNAPLQIVPDGKPIIPFKYLLNVTTREWVDMERLLVITWPGGESCIHPLPLLTAEGNGRGGGDYRGYSMGHVGRWARDLIACKGIGGTPTVGPPDDWQEIRPDFMED